VLRITVDPIWTQEDLQIAQEMSDNEKDQNDTGDRNDHFLSNGRAIESSEDIHDGFSARRARRTPQIMNATRSVKAAGTSTDFRVLMRLVAVVG